MKNLFAILIAVTVLSFSLRNKESDFTLSQLTIRPATDSADLVQLLTQLAKKEKNPLLKRHFESMAVMTSDKTQGYAFTEEDQKNAGGALAFFKGDGAKIETYLTQPRPLVMAFKSKTDGKNSYYWLFVPKDFDPKRTTDAFYMELHGSGGGSNNNPRKMLYLPFQEKVAGVTSQGYRRDGFMIYPWGRGDKGYRDTSEADVWECLADFDSMFKTDPKRQFLYGFSMGGAGTYALSQKSLDRWSAIAMYSGGARSATAEIAAKFKKTPVWLAWGEEETRTAENNKAWRDLLEQAGVEVSWAEVKGVGHKYLGEYQEKMMDWFLTHPKK